MVQWNEFQWNHQNRPESRCFLMRKMLAKIQTLKGHLTWKYWYEFHEWKHIKKKSWKSRQNMKLDRLVGRGLCNPKWWTFSHRQYRISIYWFTTKWFVTLFGFYDRRNSFSWNCHKKYLFLHRRVGSILAQIVYE